MKIGVKTQSHLSFPSSLLCTPYLFLFKSCFLSFSLYYSTARPKEAHKKCIHTNFLCQLEVFSELAICAAVAVEILYQIANSCWLCFSKFSTSFFICWSRAFRFVSFFVLVFLPNSFFSWCWLNGNVNKKWSWGD